MSNRQSVHSNRQSVYISVHSNRQSMNISDVAYRAVHEYFRCCLQGSHCNFKVLLDQLSKHIQSVAIRAVHVHAKSCLKRQSMHTSKFCLLGYQCILNILPKDTVHDYFKCCLSKRAVQTCLKWYLKGSPIIIK